jgi:hypothetical protein
MPQRNPGMLVNIAHLWKFNLGAACERRAASNSAARDPESAHGRRGARLAGHARARNGPLNWGCSLNENWRMVQS